MKISVICIYNNEKMMKEELYESLQMQNVEFEFIGLNNANQIFPSASKALNYCADKATGDILVFSHQDIRLKTENDLGNFARAINNLEVGSIVGTQGVRDRSKRYYSNLTAGSVYNEHLIYDYNEDFYMVSCVDEGFFGMKKRTWSAHHFNEDLCDDWHLYAVEACLNARKNGHSVFVFPIQLHHYSYGKITISYMDNLKKLCEYYHKDFKYIWTTCYKVKTSRVYMNCLVWIWKLNRIIRKKGLS